jgi:peptide/nickel transport system permease protein
MSNENTAVIDEKLYQSMTMIIFKRFLRHRLAVAGAIGVILFILITFFADVIASHDPVRLDMSKRFLAPFESSEHILGTDEIGRDVLSRILHGGRVSLIVGIIAMIAAIFTGTVIGIIAGFYGGKIDNFLMRLIDTLLCFPQVFLLLILAAFITPTLVSIALIIGLTSWMSVARIIRGQILQFRESDFVQAATNLGASDFRIMFKEILPNAMAPVLVAATLQVAYAILSESYISYLGFGIQPPLASWGNMLTNAQSYFDTVPWLMIIPGLMITLTVISFNFLGDGLRDALDPQVRM